MGVGKEYQKGIDLEKSFLPIKKIIPPITPKIVCVGVGIRYILRVPGVPGGHGIGSSAGIPGSFPQKNNEILFYQNFTCSIKKR